MIGKWGGFVWFEEKGQVMNPSPRAWTDKAEQTSCDLFQIKLAVFSLFFSESRRQIRAAAAEEALEFGSLL